jgi:hypothetical protein
VTVPTHVLALFALFALQGAPLPAAAPDERGYRFGDGPLREPLEAALRTVQDVGVESIRASGPIGLPPLGPFEPERWTAEDWSWTVDALRGLRDGDSSDWLVAMLAVREALRSERYADAWHGMRRLAPDSAPTLLPHFLPGIEGAWKAPNGAIPLAPAGITLRPSLPPPSGIGSVPERRRMELVGFTLGETTLAMAVIVEGDGVEVEFRHLGGPAVEFSAVIPREPRLAVEVEYVDWEPVEGVGVPRTVRIGPERAQVRLWARHKPVPPLWPGHVAGRERMQSMLGGFLVLVPEGAPTGGDGYSGLATLIRSVTGFACRVAHAPDPESEGFTPIVIDLRPPERRAEKLSAMISLIERYALEAAAAPR